MIQSNVPGVVQSTARKRFTPGRMFPKPQQDMPVVFGVSPNYKQIGSLRVVEGRFFDDGENEHAAPVAVLGQAARASLFGQAEAVGQYVKVNEQWFHVIGVVGPQLSAQNKVEALPSQDMNNLIYVPLFAAMLRQDFEPAGYEVHFVDLGDLEAARRAMQGAGLVIAETITNPLCGVPDLDALARIAAERGVPLIVDNTFATPLLCRPLELGAAVVMHSATKYLGGHSDLVAGVIAGDAKTMGAARARASRTGTTLGPFDAWLALRGLRTLDVRMRRHSENSLALASAMRSMSAVARVHHPLLESSHSYPVAHRQLAQGAGGMMAFDLHGGRDAVQRMISRFRLVTFAASLGGVETTISYPAITSHRSMSPQERAELGLGPGTVRVSVGIEDAGDIVADFEHALSV